MGTSPLVVREALDRAEEYAETHLEMDGDVEAYRRTVSLIAAHHRITRECEAEPDAEDSARVLSILGEMYLPA